MAVSKFNAGLTPAAQRTVARCRRLAADSSGQNSWVRFLVLTLLQDESLASAWLVRFGITREWLISGELGVEVARSAVINGEETSVDDCSEGFPSMIDPLAAINDPLDFTRVLDRAAEIGRRGFSDGGVSSATLLLAVVETCDFVRERFAAAGVTAERIRDELLPGHSSVEPPLQVDEELVTSLQPVASNRSAADSCEVDLANSSTVVWRVVDANLNRSREGLRVLEDFARFAANDEVACFELKALRHELVVAEQLLMRQSGIGSDCFKLLGQRDTAGDVGTCLSTSTERFRASLADVIVANCRRVQESLRSLEEFGKLLSPEFAAAMKQLRYRAYTVEKTLAAVIAVSGRGGSAWQSAFSAEDSERRQNTRARQLQQAMVYVLITEATCRLPWQEVVEHALDGGADVLQLREKMLNDRELLRRAVWTRDACRAAGALFIVNDRPDIAMASEADGVHVGQEEFTVNESRSILRPDQLVGVSTHDPEQAQQAILSEADYLGVGPVFPSQTKAFDAFPGLDFVRSASESIAKPWFAIGGISLDNLDLLISAGAKRIAVTSAVTAAAIPSEVVHEFKRRLSERSATFKR